MRAVSRRAELDAARARVAELRGRLQAISAASGGGGESGIGDEGALRDKLARLRAWESTSYLEYDFFSVRFSRKQRPAVEREERERET